MGLGLVLTGQLPAQTFKTLHNFGGSDGANPNGDLVLLGNIFYGTCYAGGTAGHGTVFAINTDGADSDESGHLFQSISDTIPGLSDSCRSEATL
jgi:uncharacterized repeat protein (TIGR03803 family)